MMGLRNSAALRQRPACPGPSLDRQRLAQEIATLNKLPNANAIKVGQSLKIPQK